MKPSNSVSSVCATAALLVGLALLGGACGKGPDSAQQGTPLADRATYTTVELPAGAVLVGADPEQIALDLFGNTEPVEGNFNESVVTLLDSPEQQVVTITQTGLPDDSVEGRLIRLDFQPDGDNWQVDWVGQQQRCQEGRGSQDWTTELCS